MCLLLSNFLSWLTTGSHTVLYSYRQMGRDCKIKFTDKLKANLWIHMDLAKVHGLKGLIFPSIFSYLHFLNVNNILTPKRRWIWVWFDTTHVCFVFSLPHLHACALFYEIKTNESHIYIYIYIYIIRKGTAKNTKIFRQ